MSISVTELGSLLDHTGPHLEAEEYIARTFGAEQSRRGDERHVDLE